MGGIERVFGLYSVAEAAQVVNGLEGAAQPVSFRLGEPVQARRKGNRLELLADEVPIGQMGGEARVGGGDEAVFGVGAEVEVVGQGGILSADQRRGAGGREGLGTASWAEGMGSLPGGWAGLPGTAERAMRTNASRTPSQVSMAGTACSPSCVRTSAGGRRRHGWAEPG